MMRCVANIRWGADREVLINIYKSLIEQQLTYGCEIFSSSRKSRTQRLEQIQLTAIRVATGAFKTSPKDSVLCDASVMPLKLKFELQTIRYRTKMKYLTNHLNHEIFVDNEYSSRPTITRPTRIRNLELMEKHNLTFNETLQKTYQKAQTSPWLKKHPNINIKLSEFTKNDTATEVYRKLFRYEMCKYTNSVIIYTDGSKTENGVCAAIGI